MGGSVMWIVLGCLIGVVIIFLMATSIHDRKKTKKIKIEKETLSKEIAAAGTIVSKEIIEVVVKNEKNIESFVPSVGKLKMSDINKEARDALKVINNSKNFKLLKHNTDQYNTFFNHIRALISEKSNNWTKRNVEDIKFFNEYKAPKPEVVKSKKQAKKDKKTKTEDTNNKKQTKKNKKAKK